MLPYFQALLFLVGGVFCYTLGGTLEKFLIEVLRHFIPVSSENLVLYNGIRLLLAIFPLFAIGALLHLAIGSEISRRDRMWRQVWTVAGAVFVFQLYDTARVLFSQALETAPGWERSHGPLALFIWDHALPFGFLGLCASLGVLFSGNDMKNNVKFVILSIALSLFWLGASQKLENHNDLSIFIFGVFLSFAVGLGSLFLYRRGGLL